MPRIGSRGRAALGQLELEGVAAARWARDARSAPDRSGRVDVASASEQDAVADVERVLEVAVDARQREPDAAHEGERRWKPTPA